MKGEKIMARCIYCGDDEKKEHFSKCYRCGRYLFSPFIFKLKWLGEISKFLYYKGMKILSEEWDYVVSLACKLYFENRGINNLYENCKKNFSDYNLYQEVLNERRRNS